MNRVPMTVQGERALREELERLKRVERPANYTGHCRSARARRSQRKCRVSAAREQQSFAEGRIKELEHKLSHAQVIDVQRFRQRESHFWTHGDAD